ncbi:hypothetical protein AALB16_11785 [Lachnospiraceae bacterium 62-35]
MKSILWRKGDRTDNRGSAILLVLTVVSLIAIFGLISLRAASTNWQMEALSRKSERNFYLVEAVLDEIYSGLGQAVGESLKESYEEVLKGLYSTYQTDEEANQAFAEKYIAALEKQLEAGLTEGGEKEAVAERLKGYAVTEEQENLTLEIGEIYDGSHIREGIEAKEESGQQIILKDLCLTLINPETGMESAITFDLILPVPEIHFMDNRAALREYILAANGKIIIEKGIESGSVELQGSIYGENIIVSQRDVIIKSSLITAGEEILITGQGSLTIMPISHGESGEELGEDIPGDSGQEEEWEEETDYEPLSHIWARNIRLIQGSNFCVNGGSLYVGDDLILQGDNNSIELEGNYYGYGYGEEEIYEGEADKKKTEFSGDSSAVIIDGRGNIGDFRKADTIVLAGRAYLDFGETKEAYPLGESISVKQGNSVYLMPLVLSSGEAGIEMIQEDGEAFPPEGNPILLSEGQQELILRIKREIQGEEREGIYKITRTETEESDTYDISLIEGEETAIIRAEGGKLYIYRRFETKEEQTEYFQEYVKEHEAQMKECMEEAGMGARGSGGILFDGASDIYTSASVYEISGETGGSLYLLPAKEPKAFGFPAFLFSCQESFENLKTYLAETVKTEGKATALPLSTYLCLGSSIATGKTEWESEGFEEIYQREGNRGILITDKDVVLDIGEASVKTNQERNMAGGLIATSKNVFIRGSSGREWRGIIIAGGNITISGRVKLSADEEALSLCLENRETAEYFRGYSASDSKRYDDFLILKNWRRGGKKHEK